MTNGIDYINYDGSCNGKDAKEQLDNVAYQVRAESNPAQLINKFLVKFHYGTNVDDKIMDIELNEDLAEYLYPALLDGYEKRIQEKKQRDEKVRRRFNENSVNQIKRVKYDKPWTIVWWKDGDVTRAKCADSDVYSESAGFNACVAKRYFQTAGAYNKVLKTYCKNDGNGGNGSQYKHGYQTGYKDGFEAAKRKKYEDMSREYDSGRNLGYEEGYDDGFAAAEVDAYDKGYDEGQKYERQLQKETNFEN